MSHVCKQCSCDDLGSPIMASAGTAATTPSTGGALAGAGAGGVSPISVASSPSFGSLGNSELRARLSPAASKPSPRIRQESDLSYLKVGWNSCGNAVVVCLTNQAHPIHHAYLISHPHCRLALPLNPSIFFNRFLRYTRRRVAWQHVARSGQLRKRSPLRALRTRSVQILQRKIQTVDKPTMRSMPRAPRRMKLINVRA